jgi:hypothetical protein
MSGCDILSSVRMASVSPPIAASIVLGDEKGVLMVRRAAFDLLLRMPGSMRKRL